MHSLCEWGCTQADTEKYGLKLYMNSWILQRYFFPLKKGLIAMFCEPVVHEYLIATD